MADGHPPGCWRRHWEQGCRPLLVGISGLKLAGKDEVTRALFPLGYRRLGFADALKYEVRTRLRGTLLAIGKHVLPPEATQEAWSEAARLDWLIRRKPEPVRLLLQEFGSEVRRADAPDYWVDRWRALWRAQGFPPVVVPDCRYENELGALAGLSAALLRVDRPDLPDLDPHPSEHGWRGWTRWDRVLTNNSTVGALHASVLDAWGVPKQWS